MEEPIVEEPIVQEPTVEEPIVQEPIYEINEVATIAAFEKYKVGSFNWADDFEEEEARKLANKPTSYALAVGGPVPAEFDENVVNTVEEKQDGITVEQSTSIVEEEYTEEWLEFETEFATNKNGNKFRIIPYLSIPVEMTTIKHEEGKINIVINQNNRLHEYDREAAALYIGYNPDEACSHMPRHVAYTRSEQLNRTFMNVVNKKGHTMSIEDVISYHGGTAPKRTPICKKYGQGICNQGKKCKFLHIDCRNTQPCQVKNCIFGH
jgi:hypothetical protein